MKIFQNKLFAIALAVIFVAGTFAFTGCTSKDASQKSADLVYVNWAEGVAYTNLAKVVLEEQMGYDVTITSADAGPAYASVGNGDKDAFMETWLPVLHKDYVEKFKDDITDLGYVYEGTQSGLVVPSYVTIDKISEMNGVKDKFDGKITGIDAGAGVMQTTEKLIDKYNLDFELVSSSGPAMTSALKGAIGKEDWIVVTGWKPHWMFGRWDLKFLKQDPNNVMWKKGNIHIMGRKNIEQDKPELAQFLRNFKFTDAQLADLMLKVNESDEDISVVAKKWMNNNMDLVNSWIPENN